MDQIKEKGNEGRGEGGRRKMEKEKLRENIIREEGEKRTNINQIREKDNNEVPPK